MNTQFEIGPELNGPQDKKNFVPVNSLDLAEMLSNHHTPPHPANLNTNNRAKNEELNKPVKHETRGIDSMAENQENIDQFYQSNLDKKWSIFDKWKNREMYEQVQEVKMELFKSSAHYRLAFYKTLLDTRLEYLNERCDAGVKMIKGNYRHQVSSYLMSKMEQLSFEVRDRQFAFLDMMKTKYAFSETLQPYPTMQQHYLTSIFEEEGKYLKFLDGLLDKFQSIIDEQLKKYN